ncbi:MAG: 50S ribosomal protein L1, partial [Patescibacteria group bacterium]
MAKTKAELLKEAEMLDLDITSKNTIAEINEAIKSAGQVKKEAEPVAEESDKPLAKAGKRSAKAVAETEEKVAKEERKASGETEDKPKPKKPVKPARSRLERRGKAYKNAAKLIEKDKEYSLKDAIAILITTAGKKFDSTAELHVRLGVDPKHADQNIRDSITLPAGTGKTLKIAVFADEETVAKAGKLDAETIGEEAVMQKLAKEEIDFDILIATPNMMQKLA